MGMPKKQGNQYEEWLPNGNRPKKQGNQYEEWLPNGNMPKKQGKQYEEWLPNGNRPKKQGKQSEEWLPNGNRPKKQGKQYEEWQQAEETRKAMARVRRNNRKQWQQAVEINTSNGESPTKQQKAVRTSVSLCSNVERKQYEHRQENVEQNNLE